MTYLPHWPIPSTLGNREIDYEAVFDRMSIVLNNLGNPHQKLPPVIHIAGTNGKGSTASLLAEILTQAGYKAHSYTSPHLHDCNERITLASEGRREKISDSFLFEIMEESRLAAKEIPLTFMEGFTIGALLAFSKIDADILIMECGMGGRIDATNILEHKIATVITPISFDHTEYLGNNIERIALEKAMIIRPNTPLICASQSQKALEIIDILAQDQKIKTHYYDRDFEIIVNEENGKFDLRFGEEVMEGLEKPSMAGEHQYINSATAIATILALKNKLAVTKEHVNQALKNTSWPSRLEKITNNLSNLLKNPDSRLFIDGAHNEAGAFALARWLKEENDKNPQEMHIISGFTRHKCRKEFLEKFDGIAQITAITVDGEPNPETAERISEIGKSIGMEIAIAHDLIEAINNIEKNDKAKRILICGSLHLARDVKKYSKLVNDE